MYPGIAETWETAWLLRNKLKINERIKNKADFFIAIVID
jgi:hypothetical protein